MAFRTDFNSLAKKVIDSEATKSSQYQISDNWFGWVTRGILHLTTPLKSERDVWHFKIKERYNHHIYFRDSNHCSSTWTCIKPQLEKDPYLRLLRMVGGSKKSFHFYEEGDSYVIEGIEANIENLVTNRSSSRAMSSQSTPEYGETIRYAKIHKHYKERSWKVTQDKGWLIQQFISTNTYKTPVYFYELRIWGDPGVQKVANDLGKLIYDRGGMQLSDFELLTDIQDMMETELLDDVQNFFTRRIRPIGTNLYRIEGIEYEKTYREGCCLVDSKTKHPAKHGIALAFNLQDVFTRKGILEAVA